eukprot:GDKJ01029091.1.p1 GENE.GDKJ01029091.1~~GDKJ01029091.1.p1  ORF type:complete len:404 (+),score=72.68 GDKJ01029091.1:1-1212(+)
MGSHMVKYIIFDIGTYAVRAKVWDDSYNDDEVIEMDQEVRTVVGRLKDRLRSTSDNEYETLFGDKAIAAVDRMKLFYPVDHSCIDNLQDVCDIIDYIVFGLLDIDIPQQKENAKELKEVFPYNIILLDNTITPKHILMKVAEHISFWNVPIVYNVFSLSNVMYHNFGLTNNSVCLIVDVGAGCCKIASFMYNFRNSNSRRVSVVDVGLEDVLDELQVEMNVRYAGQLAKTAHREILREFVLPQCYISERPSADMALPPESFQVSVPLPIALSDGTDSLELYSERWAMYEVLFDPSRIGRSSAGLAVAIANEIKSAPLDYVTELSRNIFVCGAGAAVPGLTERLQRDLSLMLSNISVKASDNHLYAHFSGLFKVLSKKDFDGQTHKGDLTKIFNDCTLINSKKK